MTLCELPLMIFHFIFIISFFLEQTLCHESGCSIDAGDLDENHPIILNEHFEFLYPDAKETIEIPKNGKVIAGCTDDRGPKLKWKKKSIYNITCEGRGIFSSGYKIINFRNLRCEFVPEFKARYSGKKCGKSFKEIEVGFEVENQFVRILDICFDPFLQNTVYSHFHMKKLLSRPQNSGRIHWINDFYQLKGESVDRVYSKKHQKRHINSLLGLAANSIEIIKDDDRHYLARGHLTAKADFYYAHQQSATFYTVNAAPQWQSFNNGNWKILENAIRKLTAKRNTDYEVYTGTYKILELTSKKSKTKSKIFLFGENDKVGLPVPLFFWKIVYNPTKRKGFAFVGVNNPYITEKDKPRHQICRSVTEKIDWVKFKDNLDLGYCYACELRQFLDVVDTAPRLLL